MTRTAAKHSDVVWLAINSTDKKHRDFLAPAQHADYDKQHGITYPVLSDSDGKVGHAYGASTTPHMFVIDEQGKVIYRGAIDDDPYGKGKARNNYVDAALSEIAQGKQVTTTTARPYGCSIKYQS